jgi:hypothetical protein
MHVLQPSKSFRLWYIVYNRLQTSWWDSGDNMWCVLHKMWKRTLQILASTLFLFQKSITNLKTSGHHKANASEVLHWPILPILFNFSHWKKAEARACEVRNRLYEFSFEKRKHAAVLRYRNIQIFYPSGGNQTLNMAPMQASNFQLQGSPHLHTSSKWRRHVYTTSILDMTHINVVPLIT